MGESTGPVTRWLLGSRADRARFRDMQTRFSSAPAFGALIGGTEVLASFWYGWPLACLVVVATITMGVAKAVHPRVRHPERLVAVAIALLQCTSASAVLLSGGGHSPLLPLMAVPVFSQAVCFRPQVTRAFVGLSAVLALLAVIGGELLGRRGDAPVALNLIGYVVTLVCLALCAQYLAASDLVARDEAVIDPLTGLFNRTALAARFPEIQIQAGLHDEDVAVVMCDVDHFKAVNDGHGHQRGDDVLRELAQRIGTVVRRSDLVFRMGGEEVLVVLPRHDQSGAAQVAERVRMAVAGSTLSGLPITLSAGVAAARGSAVELTDLVRAADRALYEAKAGGRDRVCVAA